MRRLLAVCGQQQDSELQTTGTMSFFQGCLAEGSEVEETMLHRVWQCPCNQTIGIFGATEKWCKKAEEQHNEFACFWMRGLVPKTFLTEGSQTQTCGLGNCTIGPRRRAERSVPRQRPWEANGPASRAHGLGDIGGEHQRCWQLSAQGGRSVLPHIHGKPNQSNTWE